MREVVHASDYDTLADVLRETIWMARRYADGRMTYAPTTINRAIDTLKAMGIQVEPDGATGKTYARDGHLGEWRNGKFEKE